MLHFSERLARCANKTYFIWVMWKQLRTCNTPTTTLSAPALQLIARASHADVPHNLYVYIDLHVYERTSRNDQLNKKMCASTRLFTRHAPRPDRTNRSAHTHRWPTSRRDARAQHELRAIPTEVPKGLPASVCVTTCRAARPPSPPPPRLARTPSLTHMEASNYRQTGC